MYWDQSEKKRLTRSTAQETKNSRFAEDSRLHCSTGYLDNIARGSERRACKTKAEYGL
jgi:hypothetical protein